MVEKRKIRCCFVSVLFVLGVFWVSGCAKEVIFSFDVTADTRYFAGGDYQSSEYFTGTCEAIRDVGKGAFMVSPGDMDPPQNVNKIIREILGEQYPWYLAAGNHETETPEDMMWLRERGKADIDGLVRRGPENSEETTYSFDFENSHFVIINQYYDGQSDTGADGDICDDLYQWLKKDLEANSKKHTFVFGHEPFVSIPDADNGRLRHKGDNLDNHPGNSHRFHQLLRKHDITAYINGHTHNFSFAVINGLWQIDAGHARGLGDKGARSTFLKVRVGKKNCWVDVYRDDAREGRYSLSRTLTLK